MKLDVKKIKRNFQKLTGAGARAAVVVTPVQMTDMSGTTGQFCTPSAPACVLKYRVDRFERGHGQMVITPTASMSILSLEVRDDGAGADDEADFIRRKKDVLHTIKTTTKMKRSQASTHINIINLDSIKNLADGGGGRAGKKVTSLRSLGVSLSNLFKPSKRIGRNQEMMETGAAAAAEEKPKRNEHVMCRRNSSIKSAAQYVNVNVQRESTSSLQLAPPPLPPRPAFMKQSASQQQFKPKAVRGATPHPRQSSYENSTTMPECLRGVQLVDYEMTPRLNHAQVVAYNQEVFYENQINLGSSTALKEFTHDHVLKPVAVAEELQQSGAKPTPKSVYEVKHGVSIRKKQPSMGIKAATLKTNKFAASAEARQELAPPHPALSSSSSECSMIYDSEIDMLIRQRSEVKRQELQATHRASLDQLGVNSDVMNVNTNRISAISAATFDIIESIKRAKQEPPTSLIPQSQSQQSIKSSQSDSTGAAQTLAPFLENTSFKKSHTCVIAQKAPFSPARASLSSSSKKLSIDSSSIDAAVGSSSKKTVSTSTSTSTSSLHQQHKMALSMDTEPIYENDWSVKQKLQLKLTAQYLNGSSSSLQAGKFLPKSTSSTSSASSLRSMDSTTSLSGSSCCSMTNSDMDTIVSSASSNAMGALATLPSPAQRRLFLENTTTNTIEDTTMV